MSIHSLPVTAGNAPVSSARARILERRTYLRPLDEDGVLFETPDQMLDRVIGHQRWLWERAKGHQKVETVTIGHPATGEEDVIQVKTFVPGTLTDAEEAELAELRALMDAKLVSVSGRVKWMGGTDLVKERASGSFNCSFTKIHLPADLVDTFWLLLQGCGVGFKPVTGMLTGFNPSVKSVEIVPSRRRSKGGAEENSESFENGVWTIRIGDSAKAWAKALGKIVAYKGPAHTVRIDLTQLRPGGKRLKGYGWLSSGWEPLAKALKAICQILIDKGGQILTAINIGDIVNWLGTVLSSRRSAQIWVMDDFDVELEEFAVAKIDRWQKGQGQREQSNNSILFWNKPDRSLVVELLRSILDSGDPGFVNAAAAKLRAPEFEGLNPCAEILLPSKGFCNLMQVVFHRFNGDQRGLLKALWIAGRANYRQTCVSMRDGVLQLQWDDNQHLLRLCGVSPTGYVSWVGMNDPEMMEEAARSAREGANSMADELGMPRPRRVTQVQPAGTSSKVLGLEGDEVHEGAHLNPSRFIFNNVVFPNNDPLVDMLRVANYRVVDHPTDPTAVLVTLPVAYPASPLYTRVEKEIDGRMEVVEIAQEPAVDQLERYRMLMKHYVDHNCSITVSFDADEIDAMADWFMENWDDYVGVSFLKRNDPTRTAADLGFAYLPQQAVSERMYAEYAATLLPVDLSVDKSSELIDMGECASGACPIR